MIFKCLVWTYVLIDKYLNTQVIVYLCNRSIKKLRQLNMIYIMLHNSRHVTWKWPHFIGPLFHIVTYHHIFMI